MKLKKILINTAIAELKKAKGSSASSLPKVPTLPSQNGTVIPPLPLKLPTRLGENGKGLPPLPSKLPTRAGQNRAGLPPLPKKRRLQKLVKPVAMSAQARAQLTINALNIKITTLRDEYKSLVLAKNNCAEKKCPKGKKCSNNRCKKEIGNF